MAGPIAPWTSRTKACLAAPACGSNGSTARAIPANRMAHRSRSVHGPEPILIDRGCKVASCRGIVLQCDRCGNASGDPTLQLDQNLFQAQRRAVDKPGALCGATYHSSLQQMITR